jgi:CheY-like chemotaxis protein
MNKNARVLIVDDDDVLLDLMSRRLERLGYNLDRASNGGEALEYIQRNHYDLVVTDIYMPIATGLDILESTKEKDPQTQVIVITGGGTIEIALEALEKDAFLYLTKPFDDLMVFDHVVKKALEYRQLKLSGGEAPAPVIVQQPAPVIVQQPEPEKEVDSQELKAAQLATDGSLRILLSLPDAVLLVNESGDVIFANQPARTLIDKGWNFKSLAPEDFRNALLGRRNGTGAIIRVANDPYNMRAIELPEEHGESSVLFLLHPQSILHSEGGAVVHSEGGGGTGIGHLLKEPLSVFKKGLSWLYHQRLREKEFRVLRAMAAQVSIMERLQAIEGNSAEGTSGIEMDAGASKDDTGIPLVDGPQ